MSVNDEVLPGKLMLKHCMGKGSAKDSVNVSRVVYCTAACKWREFHGLVRSVDIGRTRAHIRKGYMCLSPPMARSGAT
jgi:hypothetical protein